jgi:hypothetical protein
MAFGFEKVLFEIKSGTVGAQRREALKRATQDARGRNLTAGNSSRPGFDFDSKLKSKMRQLRKFLSLSRSCNCS